MLASLLMLATSCAADEIKGPRALRVFIIGDSITVGEMDGERAKVPHDSLSTPKYGFIPRVQRELPEIEISGIGFEGKSSLRIMERLDAELIKTPGLKPRISQADLIIFAGGLNDYWEKTSPRAAAKRVRTVVVHLKSINSNAEVYATTAISPKKQALNEWVFQYNKVLLSNSLKNLNIGPRFESLPLTELSSDGLHPGTSGYDRLAKVLAAFICDRVKAISTGSSPKIRKPNKCNTLAATYVTPYLTPKTPPAPSHR